MSYFKIDGICTKHYKINNNIKDIKEVHKKINRIKEINKLYCNIENEIDKNKYYKKLKICKEIISPKKELINDIFDYKIIDKEINYILNDIKKSKEDNNEFIKKCNRIINKYITNNIDEGIIVDISDIKNVYQVITKVISEKTYININYLEDSLKKYNSKFKDFKKEIEEDFPDIYKRIKGYFDIMEDVLDHDIIRNIENAKIKSKFL